MSPTLIALAALGSALLSVAVMAALRWYEIEADAKLAQHVRRVCVEQDVHETFPGGQRF